MNKLKSKLIELLRQGAQPEQIALTIALGLTLGIIPILGSTTLLCAAFAFRLRLNMPLIQLVNYLVYPLQLLLFIPLLMLGAALLDPGIPPLTLDGIYLMIKTDIWGAVRSLFWASTGAVLIWAVLSVPVGYAVYLAAKRLATAFSSKATGDQ